MANENSLVLLTFLLMIVIVGLLIRQNVYKVEKKTDSVNKILSNDKRSIKYGRQSKFIGCVVCLTILLMFLFKIILTTAKCYPLLMKLCIRYFFHF